MTSVHESAGGEGEPAAPPIAVRYAPRPGVYDEMVGPDGAVRPHWRRFIAGLEALRPAEIRRRWAMAERLLHENGISYNVFADPGAAPRPWQFDGIPLIISPAEWSGLEAGLQQRARLLNALLADIYGPQELIRDGTLPPALIRGNPQFLRPCHAIAPRDGVFLHSYAADLARGPDGRWWVLRDSTETPAGSGYALENRIVLSHCLPEAFRDNQVQRLAGHYLQSHQNLATLSGRDDPRIVLLAPGPGNEAFFAHAYTARYLGYSLAAGADLTVRSDRVYLKTVEGLMPVDVIVRGIDSAGADPLVPGPDCAEGAAGLVRAAAAGTVVIANAIGSAAAGCPALMAFMPNLARRLLDEDLILDNIATWWCGDPAAREHVLANFDNMAIRPAFDRADHGRGVGHDGALSAWTSADLDDDARAALIAAIDRRGYGFVGQELVAASTTPVWEDRELKPRPVVLRLFAAISGDGYGVMPGGLARISETDDARALAVDRGDRTKDVWVLSDGPVSTLSLLKTPLSMVNVRRTGKDLPSRAADNLFWLGRYAERGEDSMRLIRAVLDRLAEDSSFVGESGVMERLIAILVARGESPSDNGKGNGEAAVSLLDAPLETQILALLASPDRPYGVSETMAHLHRTAALARDRLSLDAWRTLNGDPLRAAWQRRRSRLVPAIVLGELNAALTVLSAFSGLEMENMTRSHGWRFLDMGRRIERAGHMAKVLRGVLVDAEDAHDPGLILLLDVADSFMTYRSRYVSTPMVAPVVDLLMLDETNPRSLAHQLAMLQDHVDALPQADRSPARLPEQKIALEMVTELRLGDIAELCERGPDGRRAALDRLLCHILDELPRLSELIARSYFSHAAAVHTGAARAPGPGAP